MVTSMLIIVNKTTAVQKCCRLVCNLKLNIQSSYISFTFHLTNIVTEVASAGLISRINKSTVPIYLHQDYNYHQYGKCTARI